MPTSLRAARCRSGRRVGWLLSTALVAAFIASPATAGGSRPEPLKDRREWLEVFSPDGTITREWVTLSDTGTIEGVAHAGVTAVQVSGPTATRIDLVFLGDGYTAAELGLYHEHVLSKWEELASVEPFRTYRDLFNVWAVDVVSRESGVDNDPVSGIVRDTALDMLFFCGGIERLLCVHGGRSTSYASQAPAVDQIFALANSTKYGGAGSGGVGIPLATASGGHALSGQIVVHELGHSLGGLADEYDYGGPTVYEGREPVEPNVSIYEADLLASGKRKWHRWLGEQSPDGGVVATYEGAMYSQLGIYRPTLNSIMRELGREYNLPGREALIMQFYARAPLLVSDGDAAVEGDDAIDLGLPAVRDLSIRWMLDGVEVTQWRDQGFVDLNLDGNHRLAVRVVDATPFVRDERYRSRSMTFQREWQVVAPN